MPTTLLPTLFAATLIAFQQPALPTTDRIPGPIYGVVTAVTDGDTIKTTVYPWLDLEVVTKTRISGIDTAESAGKCDYEKTMAARATAHMAALVMRGPAGRMVRLTDISHDKYGGRSVATVHVLNDDGTWTNVAHELIIAGLAKSYAGGKKEPWCKPAPGQPQATEDPDER